MLDWLHRRLAQLTNRPPAAPAHDGNATAPAPSSGGPRAPVSTQAHGPAAVAAPAAGLQRNPTAAQAQFVAAQQSLARGDLTGAAGLLRVAVQLDTQHADAQANLGAVLRDLGEAGPAEAHLEAALQLRPKHGPAAYNLAMLRINQQRWTDAVHLLRVAAQQMPADADVRYWLGNALMGLGDAAAARKAYDVAVRKQPQHAQARWGLTMAQLPTVADSAREQAEAVSSFTRELERAGTWLSGAGRRDGWRAVGAQQPYYLAYIDGNHREVMGRYGTLCCRLMASRPTPPPATRPGSVARLRLGIVSAHVHGHSVWQAILRGWVEHLDAAHFDIELFHTGSRMDAQTQWAVTRVRRLHQGLGDWTVWAETISRGGFDVLIYPEIGMDATTVRLAALRLAPHQCAAWGHPLTTGLPSIDSYISAEAFEPSDAQDHYSERLVALPRLGCAYRPYDTPPVPPDFSAWGVHPGERVILCPGVPFKYMPAHDALLVAVARQCRPCKLVFFRDGTGWMSDALASRLRRAFAADGLDFDAHAVFVPWQNHASFLGAMRAADLVLDTAGFSGFNTAMQALQVGAPLVAWEGSAMRGRFASGILRQLGLGEWVADSHATFAENAHRLCADAVARRHYKEQLSSRLPSVHDDRETVDAFAAYLRAPR